MKEKDFNIAEAWPDWNVVKKLGEGSYGAVYEIERERYGLRERAALKVITLPRESGELNELYSEGYTDESIHTHYESYIKEIIKEYKTMKSLRGHSHIVDCDDYKVIPAEDGIGWHIYIKMELLIPLPKVMLNRSNTIDDEFVTDMAEDICRALVVCNSRHIIHRDIKPDNIFVSDDGYFKLGDFGIAKTMEKMDFGTKAGTLKYMAPEVYNNKPYGDNVDIYSLGMVMYWMLNDYRMPFLPLPPETPTSKQKEDASIRRLRGDAIPAPKNGSDQLKAVVLKACEFDPAKRYASAEEMLRDLEAISDPNNEVYVNTASMDLGGTSSMFQSAQSQSQSPSQSQGRYSGYSGYSASTRPGGDNGTLYQGRTQYQGSFSENSYYSGNDNSGNKRVRMFVIAAACALALIIAILAILGITSRKHHNVNVNVDEDEQVTATDNQEHKGLLQSIVDSITGKDDDKNNGGNNQTVAPAPTESETRKDETTPSPVITTAPPTIPITDPPTPIPTISEAIPVSQSDLPVPPQPDPVDPVDPPVPAPGDDVSGE